MGRKGWLSGMICLGLVGLDQWTKQLALTHLTSPRSLLPGVLGLRLAWNTGGAFSLPLGGALAAGILSLTMLALGSWLMMRLVRGRWLHAAMILIASGGVGNAVDRFLRGAVVDMIRMEWITFPIFNVADIYVTTGAALLILSLITAPQEWKERPHGK